MSISRFGSPISRFYGIWLKPREFRGIFKRWRILSTPGRNWLANSRHYNIVICEERYEEGPRQPEDRNCLVYGNLDPCAEDSEAEGFADEDSLRKDLGFNSVDRHLLSKDSDPKNSGACGINNRDHISGDSNVEEINT